MKKTINISLAGISFVTEDDAYHRLDEYLNSLRKHFATFPDAEEIVRDIEARFAEQFSGKAGGVQAITLAEVESLIASMGSPEQFGDEQQEKKEESSRKDTFILGKKLYRNPDDAIIAGVASGIAAYFGVDAIWVRLLFVLVTFATGFGILIYIVMWILMPEAKTETEKMQMRGEAVNLKNLEQIIKERAEELKKTAPEGARKAASEAAAATARVAKTGSEAIKKIFSVFFKIVGAVVSVAGAVAFAGLLLVMGTILFNIDSPYINFPFRELAHGAVYYSGLISVLFIVAVPLFFIMMIGSSLVAGSSQFRKMTVLSLLALWMVSGVIFANAALRMMPQVHAIIENHSDFKTVTREFPVGAFTQVKISGGDSAEIIASDTFRVVAEGGQRRLDVTSAKIENGLLTLSHEDASDICFFCIDRPLHYQIYAPTLSGITATGSSEVVAWGFESSEFSLILSGASQAELEIVTDDFTAQLSGASRLVLAGLINQTKFTLSGASRVDAESASIESVDARLSGASRLLLGDIISLKSNTSGASRVEYWSVEESDVQDQNLQGNFKAE